VEENNKNKASTNPDALKQATKLSNHSASSSLDQDDDFFFDDIPVGKGDVKKLPEPIK